MAVQGEPGVDYPIYGEIPQTGFKCSDQKLPGYYGDQEAKCQVLHICQAGELLFDFDCAFLEFYILKKNLKNKYFFRSIFFQSQTVEWTHFCVRTEPFSHKTTSSVFGGMVSSLFASPK